MEALAELDRQLSPDSILRHYADKLGYRAERVLRELKAVDGSQHKLTRRYERRWRRKNVRLERRTDKAELDRYSAEAEQRDVLRRADSERDRFQARKSLRIGQRIDLALLLAERLSDAQTTAQKETGQTGQTKPESRAPHSSGQLLFESDPEALFSYYRRRFELMATLLERQVDIYMRRPVSFDQATETTDEKDKRIIRDYEGWPASEVAMLDPTAGSERAVFATRKAYDRRPSDGRRAK